MVQYLPWLDLTYGNPICQNATLANVIGVGILIAVFNAFAARASIQLYAAFFFS